ncbi:SCO5389 family protein [Streptomyces collinus]|uniref:SCO5389 family protein n=1 Tax=Streptomyces collinus TaxID=42684 RepID=UPI0036BB904D
MPLDMHPTLLARVERGEVTEADFIVTVRKALPYAYEVISRLTAWLDGAPTLVVDNTAEPASENQRVQLLRALASDAIRTALERHFGVRLALQDSHRVAVVRTDLVWS